MTPPNIEKHIYKEPATSGQFLIYGLRDAPGRPFEGGIYLAARAYDEYTADILVKALKIDAQKVINNPPTRPSEVLIKNDLTKPPPEGLMTNDFLKPSRTKKALDEKFKWPNAGRKKRYSMVKKPPPRTQLPEGTLTKKVKLK